jgi:hypothetical protein
MTGVSRARDLARIALSGSVHLKFTAPPEVVAVALMLHQFDLLIAGTEIE